MGPTIIIMLYFYLYILNPQYFIIFSSQCSLIYSHIPTTSFAFFFLRSPVNHKQVKQKYSRYILVKPQDNKEKREHLKSRQVEITEYFQSSNKRGANFSRSNNRNQDYICNVLRKNNCSLEF